MVGSVVLCWLCVEVLFLFFCLLPALPGCFISRWLHVVLLSFCSLLADGSVLVRCFSWKRFGCFFCMKELSQMRQLRWVSSLFFHCVFGESEVAALLLVEAGYGNALLLSISAFLSRYATASARGREVAATSHNE